MISVLIFVFLAHRRGARYWACRRISTTALNGRPLSLLFHSSSVLIVVRRLSRRRVVERRWQVKGLKGKLFSSSCREVLAVVVDACLSSDAFPAAALLVDMCVCSGWARAIPVRTCSRLRMLWTHCVVSLLAPIPPF